MLFRSITRAMDILTLTCAKMRMIRGETQYNQVSRFVREIPSELLENQQKTFGREEDTRSFERNGFAGTGSRNVGNSDSASHTNQDFRPKAVVRPKAVIKPEKPYISKDMRSLNQLAGISKGMPHQAPGELSYQVGDRVKHVKYGEGKVINIDREPKDYKVTVEFDKAGQKIMYASFAKLKRV